jgi:hypothetical protein
MPNSGESRTESLHGRDDLEFEAPLGKFYGWYDLIVTVAGYPSFKYRLGGHVETGKDSMSDPAPGGLVPSRADPKQGACPLRTAILSVRAEKRQLDVFSHRAVAFSPTFVRHAFSRNPESAPAAGGSTPSNSQVTLQLAGPASPRPRRRRYTFLRHTSE